MSWWKNEKFASHVTVTWETNLSFFRNTYQQKMNKPEESIVIFSDEGLGCPITETKFLGPLGFITILKRWGKGSLGKGNWWVFIRPNHNTIIFFAGGLITLGVVSWV